MANETAIVKQQKGELANLLEARKETILSVLNRRLDLDYFVSTALLHVSENDYTLKVARGNPNAFVKAVVKAAEFGLSFSKGQAFLVPFKDVVVFIAGYQGLVQTMLRGQSRIHDIRARIVYENELFEWVEGTNPQLIHKPLETVEDRGKIRGAYAVAFFRDGGLPHAEYMSLEELDKRRNAAKERNKGRESDAWRTWEDEMYLRAPIRKLFKFIPQTEEGQKIMAYEDELWGYDQSGDKQEDRRPTGQRVHDRIKQKKADMRDEAEAQYVDLPPTETVDESTGEVVDVPAEEPEQERPQTKKGRPKKSEEGSKSAGTFAPELARETLVELVDGGKVTTAQYHATVKESLSDEYPAIVPPVSRLAQDEAATVLEALGYTKGE